MKALSDLKVFVHAVQLGSLSAAARLLGMTPAAASVALKRLEADVGKALVVRSTRTLRATGEGERFLERTREALHLLEEAELSLRTDEDGIGGALTLSVPSDLGRNHIIDWLDAFKQRHPALTLRIEASDRVSDFYRNPFDVAIRYGEPPDSNLVAVPLIADSRRVLCASPGYLKRHGEPDTPLALAGHNCLSFVIRDETHRRWTFTGPNDDIVVIDVDGDRVSEDGDVVRRWAIAGHGIACKSWPDVAADVSAGRLSLLCRGWRGESAPLNLVCADRRQLDTRLRTLIAFLRECCSRIPPIPA